MKVTKWRKKPRRTLLSKGLVAVVLVGLGLWAGCGGGSGDQLSLADLVFVDLTPTPVQLPTEDDIDDGRFSGRQIDPRSIPAGVCFNQYSYRTRSGIPRDLTTAVACTTPHRAEVYAVHQYPAGPDAPYPGEDTVRRWGQDSCYAQFQEYVGLQFELSLLSFDLLTPSRDSWLEEPGDRRVACYLFSRDKHLIGSMRNIGL